MMILMGLYLADWWRGLTKLENLGRYLWVYIQPWGKKLMPVTSLPRAFLLGGLWGWLPCGLVYAALASALTQPAPMLAAGAMFAFGLGTLPAVLAAGFMAQRLARALQQRALRLLMALVVILLGVWVVWAAYSHYDHVHHHSARSVDDLSHEHHQHSDLIPAASSASQRTDGGEQMPENISKPDGNDSISNEADHHHH
jgi:sulfite exporter TauE/SafE